MSTARVETLTPEPAHRHIVRRTVEACRLAKEAAGAAAEGIATGSIPLLIRCVSASGNSMRSTWKSIPPSLTR